MSQLDPSRFICDHQYGVLSTQSSSYPGYPFGSIVPYLISPSGRIAIYISELAEHSKNIGQNNKVALTISDISDAASPGSGARITCLADAVVSTEPKTLSILYRQQFSDAETILQLPGFQFYELDLQAIRLIGGFGNIQWLSPTQLVLK